ncbi:MAG TPA: alpha-glucan family phosphorylase [Caldithrix abyssi]|uniref:Alpha-glucan family phosphorylase n=1 Tax=Caldithrix abyssi TaxID=187145 RepID=A0A7V4U250_CALAY|nr:alpha-glucan family phosphorylase [Caldithrix abyssi]
MNRRFNLPENLQPLEDLAYNLWFSWNPEARDLYRDIDLDLWRRVGRNPVAFLAKVDPEKLETFNEDAAFVGRLQLVYKRFRDYLNENDTRFKKEYPSLTNQLVAYFSAEYGIHESLPNYAGGLGILAGDHCKTASDLGLPFVAVGLMYKHAYFTQKIDENGNQQEEYRILDHDQLPVTLVKDESGKPILVSVPILDHNVYIQIWQVKVGRISLYLLDTSVDKNSDDDKEIIHSLYGGTRDTRMKQEIILGIGGLRALRKLGLQPTVFHMNEGHSAFLGLERLYELMNAGLSFRMALEFVRSTTLFTTHTPIPAGNEAFSFEMMERYFSNFWPELEISDDYFFDLGRDVNVHQHESFSLTVLALNLSYMANGVSKLHGEVSRKMWCKVFPGIPIEEVPIGHITNGVHVESWLHREMIALFDKYLDEDWRLHIHEQQYWDKVKEIPDEVFWDTMQKMKRSMTDHLRRLYAERLQRYPETAEAFPPPDKVLDENVLTIGFARRFAPYKRATLMFRDVERLKKILNDPERPVQVLFSGKAHPHNEAGKELIRTINQYAKEKEFLGRVIFIENYSINISRSMVSGVDLWLNNPRRPLEASGTSGQKVPINGGINFSVLDGWWPEGYNGENGWTIGRALELPDSDEQDREDAESLYTTLESEIIPLYYNRDKAGIPHGWVKKAKESLRSLLTPFSTHTMVWNYIQKYYVPGMKRNILYTENDFAGLFRFYRWQNRMRRHWKNLSLKYMSDDAMSEDVRILSAGENREISVKICMDGLKPEELKVELVLERQDSIKQHADMEIHPMGLIGKVDDDVYEYRARVTAKSNTSYRFNCRVIPTHPDLFHPMETRLIKWLD